MKTTRTIAGHEITLEAGKNYLATRPMARTGRKSYPITIYGERWYPEWHIDGLNYDEANDFLAEFNNGEMSFDGRDW